MFVIALNTLKRGTSNPIKKQSGKEIMKRGGIYF